MGVAAAALIVSTAGITYMLTTRSLQNSRSNVAMVTPPTPQNDQVQSSGGSDSGAAQAQTTASQSDVRGTDTQRGQAGSRPTQPRTPTQSRVPGASLANRPLEPQQSDVVYSREIDMLQKIVTQRKSQLDSSTVAIIERNLRIIDAAIEQSKAALAKDPASRLLSAQLTHALDKKVELLRTAALLPAST
jgi:hypothetical protein